MVKKEEEKRTWQMWQLKHSLWYLPFSWPSEEETACFSIGRLHRRHYKAHQYTPGGSVAIVRTLGRYIFFQQRSHSTPPPSTWIHLPSSIFVAHRTHTLGLFPAAFFLSALCSPDLSFSVLERAGSFTVFISGEIDAVVLLLCGRAPPPPFTVVVDPPAPGSTPNDLPLPVDLLFASPGRPPAASATAPSISVSIARSSFPIPIDAAPALSVYREYALRLPLLLPLALRRAGVPRPGPPSFA